MLALGVSGAILAILWRTKVREFPGAWRRRADATELLVLSVLIAVVVVGAYRNLTTPSAWDFPGFYTVARNASNGLSFYSPEALVQTFTQIQQEANVPADWLAESGFWYAPPTALILVPLGTFGYSMALVLHYLVQGALFAGSVVLLHRFYPLRRGAMGLVEMAILALAFRPVISALGLAQIVFGALFLTVVAMWLSRNHPWLAGLSLGAGALFKHLLLIPAVLSPALRKSRIAAGALVTSVAAGALAGWVFGFGVYREFITFGPGDRSPELSLDPVIQSLNGVLRRAFDAVPSDSGPIGSILYPPYLIIAGLLTAVTILIAWKARCRTEDTTLVFAFLTVLSLIVYPNTLYNTLPLVIPVFVVLLHRIDDLPVPRPGVVVFVAALYGAVAGIREGAFVSLMLTWLFLAACLVTMARRSPSPAVSVPLAAESGLSSPSRNVATVPSRPSPSWAPGREGPPPG